MPTRCGLTRKPWVKTSLAPGLEGGADCTWKKPGLLPELEQLGFGIVAFACTTCNGMTRRAGSGDPARDRRPRPVRHRRAVGQPQLRRPHPSVRASRPSWPRRRWWSPTRIAGTVRFDIEKDVLGTDRERQARSA
jgi:aconitate hydratase